MIGRTGKMHGLNAVITCGNSKAIAVEVRVQLPGFRVGDPREPVFQCSRDGRCGDLVQICG